MTNVWNFLNAFIKYGLPQGLLYATGMAAVMWLADQPLSWIGFSIWLFGFAIFLASVEYFRIKKENTKKTDGGVVAASNSDPHLER